MRMNNETKLVFALEHIAHLEDLIVDNEYETYLSQSLSTMKYELIRQLSLEKNRKEEKMTTEEDRFNGSSEGDLIAELLCITGELGGRMDRLTTFNSDGKTTKKIVIEYDEKTEERVPVKEVSEQSPS
jgi:hypothetical protein